MVSIPLLGTIAAGEPIAAISQREFISVPKIKSPTAHREAETAKAHRG